MDVHAREGAIGRDLDAEQKAARARAQHRGYRADVPGLRHDQRDVPREPREDLDWKARLASLPPRPRALVSAARDLRGAPGDPAFAKLVNLMGQQRANEVIRDAMARAGLTSISTPDERYAFGSALMSLGGLCEAVGRAIRIQAILQGAKGQ